MMLNGAGFGRLCILHSTVFIQAALLSSLAGPAPKMHTDLSIITCPAPGASASVRAAGAGLTVM